MELRYNLVLDGPVIFDWDLPAYHADVVLIEPDDTTAYQVVGGHTAAPSLAGTGGIAHLYATILPGCIQFFGSESPNSSNIASAGAGSGGAGEELGAWGRVQGVVNRFGTNRPIREGRLIQDEPYNDPRPKLRVLDNNKPCEEYKRRMEAYVNDVESKYIPYNPASSNSNALANGALDAAGIQRPPMSQLPVWAPGSNYDLLRRSFIYEYQYPDPSTDSLDTPFYGP